MLLFLSMAEMGRYQLTLDGMTGSDRSPIQAHCRPVLV
jgi:hypothetical protein